MLHLDLSAETILQQGQEMKVGVWVPFKRIEEIVTAGKDESDS